MYKQYLQQTLDFIKANPEQWYQGATPSLQWDDEPTCFGGWLMRIMGMPQGSYLGQLPDKLYEWLYSRNAFSHARTLPELEQIVNEYQDNLTEEKILKAINDVKVRIIEDDPTTYSFEFEDGQMEEDVSASYEGAEELAKDFGYVVVESF